MKSTVIDNASGATGTIGIGMAKLNDPNVFFSFMPNSPSEWLIMLSTLLVSCQLIHWGDRFLKWGIKINKR